MKLLKNNVLFRLLNSYIVAFFQSAKIKIKKNTLFAYIAGASQPKTRISHQLSIILIITIIFCISFSLGIEISILIHKTQINTFGTAFLINKLSQIEINKLEYFISLLESFSNHSFLLSLFSFLISYPIISYIGDGLKFSVNKYMNICQKIIFLLFLFIFILLSIFLYAGTIF